MLQLYGNGLTAQIKETGAELHSLRVEATGEELVWQGDPAVWKGQAPLLFPIVGALRDGRYRWRGAAYELGRHGFARQSVFRMVSASPEEAVLALSDSAATRVCYPFAFTLTAAYRLRDEGLEIVYTVENPGAEPLPFSIGAHPGFCCRLGDTLRFEHAEKLETRLLDADGTLTHTVVPIAMEGDRLPITAELFARDALIFEHPRSHEATIEKRGGANVTVRWGDAPLLGVWAKPGAPYVCVEPWYGRCDDEDASGELAEKPFLRWLEPRQRFVFSFQVIIHNK